MKISCIIPAHNEEERILSVLNAVVGHKLLDEVIVVDDGSTDSTKQILENYSGINFISYSQNRGKTFALMTGIKKSKNDLIILIDSDLIGLQLEDISNLILPVVDGQADMTLSLRQNSLLIFKILRMDFVSGERVFSKRIIGDLDQLERLPCFGFESFLNQIVIKNHLRLKVVYWNEVICPRKSKKFGWWKGMKGDYRMIREIISVVKISGIISQMLKMRSLRVR